MKKIEIMNSVSRSFHKVGFTLKKHSPEILIAAGIVGVVTSAVVACKATTKLDGILANAKEDLDQIHKAMEHPEDLLTEQDKKEQKDPATVYTEDDGKKDLTIVYAKTAKNVVKLYAPAVGLGVLSITAILAGHNITRKRNLALAAAYTAVDKGFKEYRNRVIDRFGKEIDHELKYNIKAKEIEEVVVNEDGSEQVVTKTVEVMDDENRICSPYAKFFDESCKGWTKDPDYNLMFLRRQQDYATDKLKAQGYLFLNDVYDMLGIDRTKAGAVVGWIYDKKNPVGDNYVDFGLYDMHRVGDNRKFVNGYEKVALLDFNVDGNILSHFEEA